MDVEGAASPPQQTPPNPAFYAVQGTLSPGQVIQIQSLTVTVERLLGQGSFAYVYLVRTQTPVNGTTQHVLKRMLVADNIMLQDVKKEVDIMRALKGHANIVNFIDSAWNRLQVGRYEVFILMEFCAGGGLIDLMNRRLAERLTEGEILQIFADVCEGVAAMHTLQPALLHRDLRIENILQASDASYKLCDFGSATAVTKPPITLAEMRALEHDLNRRTNLLYRAPEMVEPRFGRPIDEKSDVWALGVLLYKLCYYTAPFEDHGTLAILHAQYKIPPCPSYSQGMIGLITSILQEHGAQRPTVFEILISVNRMRGTKSRHSYTPRPQPPSPAVPRSPEDTISSRSAGQAESNQQASNMPPLPAAQSRLTMPTRSRPLQAPTERPIVPNGKPIVTQRRGIKMDLKFDTETKENQQQDLVEYDLLGLGPPPSQPLMTQRTPSPSAVPRREWPARVGPDLLLMAEASTGSLQPRTPAPDPPYVDPNKAKQLSIGTDLISFGSINGVDNDKKSIMESTGAGWQRAPSNVKTAHQSQIPPPSTPNITSSGATLPGIARRMSQDGSPVRRRSNTASRLSQNEPRPSSPPPRPTQQKSQDSSPQAKRIAPQSPADDWSPVEPRFPPHTKNSFGDAQIEADSSGNEDDPKDVQSSTMQLNRLPRLSISDMLSRYEVLQAGSSTTSGYTAFNESGPKPKLVIGTKPTALRSGLHNTVITPTGNASAFPPIDWSTLQQDSVKLNAPVKVRTSPLLFKSMESPTEASPSYDSVSKEQEFPATNQGTPRSLHLPIADRAVTGIELSADEIHLQSIFPDLEAATIHDCYVLCERSVERTVEFLLSDASTNVTSAPGGMQFQNELDEQLARHLEQEELSGGGRSVSPGGSQAGMVSDTREHILLVSPRRRVTPRAFEYNATLTRARTPPVGQSPSPEQAYKGVGKLVDHWLKKTEEANETAVTSQITEAGVESLEEERRELGRLETRIREQGLKELFQPEQEELEETRRRQRVKEERRFAEEGETPLAWARERGDETRLEAEGYAQEARRGEDNNRTAEALQAGGLSNDTLAARRQREQDVLLETAVRDREEMLKRQGAAYEIDLNYIANMPPRGTFQQWLSATSASSPSVATPISANPNSGTHTTGALPWLSFGSLNSALLPGESSWESTATGKPSRPVQIQTKPSGLAPSWHLEHNAPLPRSVTQGKGDWRSTTTGKHAPPIPNRQTEEAGLRDFKDAYANLGSENIETEETNSGKEQWNGKNRIEPTPSISCGVHMVGDSLQEETGVNASNSGQSGGLDPFEEPRTLELTSDVPDIFKYFRTAPDLGGKITIQSHQPVYSGSFSRVYRGEFKQGDQSEAIAIKVLNEIRGAAAKTMQRKLKRERRTWGALRHPNILPLYGFVNDEEMFKPHGALVSPWCKNGDAQTYLEKHGPSLDTKQRINLWKDVMAGVDHLHSHSPLIIHGDLKPRNVLIDDSGKAQLCDFGLVTILADGNSGMTTTSPYTGTERYLSRELIVGGDDVGPTTASDIYAAGCIGLEFIFSQIPYSSRKNNSRGGIFAAIKARLPPATCPADLTPTLQFAWELLAQCWDLAPSKRPPASSLLLQLETWKPDTESDNTRLRAGVES